MFCKKLVSNNFAQVFCKKLVLNNFAKFKGRLRKFKNRRTVKSRFINFQRKSYVPESLTLKEKRTLSDITLREKCPNTELFLVRIFLYSD